MDVPLLVSSMIEHAAQCHGDTEIVARQVDGSIHRYTYRAACARSKRLARVLMTLGVQAGERIASLAWNTHHHFELFYGVSGIGAVLHTVNPRLFDKQIVYVINHAEDRTVFVDAATLGIAERIAPDLPQVRQWVFMGAPGSMPASSLPGLLDYEVLLAGQGELLEWPSFDERWAASICYTSGSTGDPKGVAYSHRSAMLSAMCMSLADMIGGYVPGSLEVVMPIAAMFHGNAWQMVYSAPMNGHKLVLPGRAFEPEKILELLVGEGVTIAAAVPTVWHSIVDHLEKESTGLGLGKLRAAMMAGARPPASLIEKLERNHGLMVSQTWGMTEALGGTKATVAPGANDLPLEADTLPPRRRQGRANFLVTLRLLDENGRVLPHEGMHVGHLHLRGPYVAAGYFGDVGKASFDWLDSGDLARVFADGSIEIVDRAKDVIKSGGEWISTLQLEAGAISHPAVLYAAAVGIPHPKWQERPLLMVVCRADASVSDTELRALVATQLASWWMPDEIRFVTQIPLTGTGKIDKKTLRQQLALVKLANAE